MDFFPFTKLDLILNASEFLGCQDATSEFKVTEDYDMNQW